MPSYFKVFNSFPSFIPTFTQDGVERANPLPNYRFVGDHLQDYCENRIAETPHGGYSNLVAFLASEKSITSIYDGSLSGMANSLSVSYRITTHQYLSRSLECNHSFRSIGSSCPTHNHNIQKGEFRMDNILGTIWWSVIMFIAGAFLGASLWKWVSPKLPWNK